MPTNQITILPSTLPEARYSPLRLKRKVVAWPDPGFLSLGKSRMKTASQEAYGDHSSMHQENPGPVETDLSKRDS